MCADLEHQVAELSKKYSPSYTLRQYLTEYEAKAVKEMAESPQDPAQFL